ncbi:GIY-YIG nuclease family protein [Brachybacterium sp. Marseille-Q7125]|uniref:GIY-YIG nuclease family protein n=1 Tax=Brachybacterium sp. Marseille-Q7125 TaxID=2932815 RepID=UPI001FF4209B|nr:GIY-YIG nuclease family protein [Brachybacterium sp. Marseille-Q7125]
MNWTGHVLKGKREKLEAIRQRPEAQRTGVYILLGDDPEDPSRRLGYIGQSDNIATRLYEHERKKDFWTEVLLITSKDANITSAHARYLESRLIALAESIGRVPLVNGNRPTGGADLPEADASDMQYFIEQVKVILPVLGVDLFRGRATRPVSSPASTAPQLPMEESPAPKPEESPVFRLLQPKRGIDARAQVIDGEFTVLTGSTVAAKVGTPRRVSTSTERQLEARRAQHEALLEDGSIKRLTDGTARLTRDVVFSSPSQAGAVVLGRVSLNGRTAWITDDGRTFAAWEE